MGILQKIKRAFLNLDCRGCGKPLLGFEDYACSDECQEKAEAYDAVR